MTEEEWLSDERDLTPLLIALQGRATGLPPGFRSSARKERLLAVACSRSEFVKDRRLHRAIEVVERFADGLTTEDEIQKAREAAYGMPSGPERSSAVVLLAPRERIHLASVFTNAEWLEMAHLPSKLPMTGMRLAQRKIWRIQASLLRDIFGNPFRPVAVDPGWRRLNVVSLAEAIYTDRAFDRLPLLAGALEDAGCTDADLLGHLRGPGPHVRGCWAVDLLLTRS
jgi:hypothetical protein